MRNHSLQPKESLFMFLAWLFFFFFSLERVFNEKPVRGKLKVNKVHLKYGQKIMARWSHGNDDIVALSYVFVDPRGCCMFVERAHK